MASRTTPDLHLSQVPAADALLSHDPLALLIGMVLDQQVPLEWAFQAPLALQERLGRPLDAADLAAMDSDELTEAFCRRPALHRFPAANAKRVQALCVQLVERYDGRAEGVWTTAADGGELLANVKALPGFGDQKARIFVALLGKQFGVRPAGWRAAAAPYGEPGSTMSVADIDGPDTLAAVRRYKQEKKAAAKAAAGQSS